MINRMTPMNERILLEPISLNDRSDSALIIPESAQRTHQYFKVLKVGPGMITPTGSRVEPTLKEDDIVLMLVRSGTPLRINGVEYRITTEREIILKVDQ